MIELTLEQRKAVTTDAETPPRVIDPSTHTISFQASASSRPARCRWRGTGPLRQQHHE